MGDGVILPDTPRTAGAPPLPGLRTRRRHPYDDADAGATGRGVPAPPRPDHGAPIVAPAADLDADPDSVFWRGGPEEWGRDWDGRGDDPGDDWGDEDDRSGRGRRVPGRTVALLSAAVLAAVAAWTVVQGRLGAPAPDAETSPPPVARAGVQPPTPVPAPGGKEKTADGKEKAAGGKESATGGEAGSAGGEAKSAGGPAAKRARVTLAAAALSGGDKRSQTVALRASGGSAAWHATTSTPLLEVSPADGTTGPAKDGTFRVRLTPPDRLTGAAGRAGGDCDDDVRHATIKITWSAAARDKAEGKGVITLDVTFRPDCPAT